MGATDNFVYDPKREASMNEGSDFDDQSSYSSASGHSNSTDDYPTQSPLAGDADAFADNLAKKLTRDVKVWRSIVSFMLLLTAILVTVSTYLFLTNEETRDFTEAVSQSGHFRCCEIFSRRNSTESVCPTIQFLTRFVFFFVV